MAFVDDPNNNSQSEQIAGASPLSNEAPSGQATDAAQQAPQGGSQPSTIQSGSTPASTNKKAPKASSGMFTNIQKYVDKNKPSAQKMAESSVSDIRKTQDDIKAKQQATLQQFTNKAQTSGLHDTAARVQDVSQYTTEQANLPQQAPVTQAENSGQSQQAPVNQIPAAEENKFASIINANYSGPKNLVETGNLYQNSLDAANKAGRVGELAQSTQGREQLLRDKFTQGGKQYTQGTSQLDNLLMGQQTPQIQQMQSIGKGIGSSQELMKGLTANASDIANQTQAQVADTKDQARAEFQRISQERQGQIDSRVGDVIENWDKLPAHFRATMSNPDGTVNLSAIEAATLGVQSGEGLYNVTGEDLFGTTEDPAVAAERARLISSQEQGNLSRLQALSNLSQGGDKLYDINKTDYFNKDLAGTQNAFDALNLDGVRSQLANAERGFRADAAMNQTGRGHGNARYNRGGGRGRKAINKTASQSANLQELLSKQGYDFNKDIQTESSANLDALKALSQLGNVSNAELDDTPDQEEGVISKGRFGENTDIWKAGGEKFEDYSNMGGLEGKGIGFTNENMQKLGEGIQDGSRDLEKSIFRGNNTLVGDIMTTPTEALGKGIANLGSGLKSATKGIFGGGKATARREATERAEAAAKADLTRKLTEQFNNSGFTNRIGVSDNEETAVRDQKLRELLQRLDTTNSGE